MTVSGGIEGQLYSPLQPWLPMREHPLDQACSGLTWMLKHTLSTRIRCFQSCSLLTSQTEAEAALSPKVFSDCHREETEVHTSIKLFLRLQAHQTSSKRRQTGQECTILMIHTKTVQSVNKAQCRGQKRRCSLV